MLQGQPGEAAGECQADETTDHAAEQTPVACPGSPVPGPSTPAAALTGQQRRTARRRSTDGSQDGPSAVELAILESLKRPHLSPTEHCSCPGEHAVAYTRIREIPNT
ncbi:hypothetical protein ACER0C_002463 [Sarotherodon galilaeus]